MKKTSKINIQKYIKISMSILIAFILIGASPAPTGYTARATALPTYRHAVSSPTDSSGITVSSTTDAEEKKIGALWSVTFSDPYFMGTSMTSTPIVTDSSVYVVNKDMLYDLDKKSGKVQRELKLPARMNSVCDPARTDNYLYIPLSDGIMTCVDTTDMHILWTSENMSERFGMNQQTLGRMRLYGGYLYAGTWCRSDNAQRMSASSGQGTVSSDNARQPSLHAKGTVGSDSDIASDGVFFCIDTRDGHTVWTYRDDAAPVGFYWTESVAAHGRIFFTSEDGMLISHSPTEDTVYEKIPLTDGLMLRNGLCSSPDGNHIFTVSKTGMLIRINLDYDGKIQSIDKAPLMPDVVNCTSTPAYCDGTLYTGCMADGCGYMCVTDASTLKLRYAAKGKPYGEIKSHPLVIRDASISDTVTDKRQIYFTANESTGSLYQLTDTPDAASGKIKTLFTPYSAKQYCLADVVADEDGILYYSNDSGTLFAIGETDRSADIPEEKTVDKPYDIKTKHVDKGIKITWKKKDADAVTEIYIKTRNKWKLYKSTKKKKLILDHRTINKALAGRNHFYIRLRCRMKISGDNKYSSFTKQQIIYKKMKAS